MDKSEILQLNFNVINRFDDRLFIEFSMKDDTGKFTDEENFKRIHINMANPLDNYYNNNELSKIEKVLVMFQLTSKKQLKEISKGDEDLENMAKIIEDLNEDEHIIGLYDKEKMDEWMKKIDHDEAVKEGLEQGIEQGSKVKALEIAKKLLESGMNISDVSKFTGLNEKELKAENK